MAVEVHVAGRIVTGKLGDFTAAVQHYGDYAEEHGYVRPRVLLGVSGPMNTVRLVYSFPDLNAYERLEERVARDRRYGELAMAMQFVDGSIEYEIYRVGSDPGS